MSLTKTLALLASAARTTGATGSAVSTSIKNRPITSDQDRYSRHMLVYLDVSAYTSGTSDLTVQGQFVASGTWFTLTPSQPWTTISVAGQQVRRYEGPIPLNIRAVTTGTCSATYRVDADVASGT